MKKDRSSDIFSILRKYRWKLFLSALVTMVLVFGTLGYLSLGYSTSDSIFLAVKLLGLALHSYTDLPWQLEVGRFLSVFLMVSALLKAFLFFFSEQVSKPLRLKRNKDHVVIFGFNEHVEAFIEDIRKEGTTNIVVVTKNQIENEYIDSIVETVVLPSLSYETMEMLALKQTKHIVCMNMDDELDFNYAQSIIEFFNKYKSVNTDAINLHIHLNSYTIPDLFNHEDRNSIFQTVSCNLKFFNQQYNAARLLFETVPMEKYLSDDKPAHWLLSGDWHQQVSMMRYIAMISYYEDEQLPHITLLHKDHINYAIKLKTAFPQIEKTAHINVVETYEKLAVTTSITHIAVLFDNKIEGLEFTLHISSILTTPPIFLLESYGSETINERIHFFGVLQDLNTKKIILDEVLDSRAKKVHAFYKKQYSSLPDWEQLSVFKKNSNRMQAEHISIKLRGIGWKDKQCFEGFDEFITSHSNLVHKWARIEHLRWNAFHYVHGWQKPEEGEERDDSKKRHPDLILFNELSLKSQKKDYPAIENIPNFI